MSAPAELALQSHNWPGNVRELENVIQRALILSSGPLIGPEHLNLVPRFFSEVPVAPAVVVSTRDVSGLPELEKRADNMKDLERDHILRTLAEVGGSRRQAIERLGDFRADFALQVAAVSG